MFEYTTIHTIIVCYKEVHVKSPNAISKFHHIKNRPLFCIAILYDDLWPTFRHAPHLYILPTVEKTVQTQISVFNDCEMKRHKK